MLIRNIKSEDLQQWLPLWEGYNSFYKRTIDKEVTAKTFQRFLEPNEPVHALVVEVDGKIVAFATYLFHRHTAMLNDVCYLQDLFTDNNLRGRGYGKSLILAVAEKAKEAGSLQVYWMTHESNQNARILYDKIAKYSGFIVYSKRA